MKLGSVTWIPWRVETNAPSRGLSLKDARGLPIESYTCTATDHLGGGSNEPRCLDQDQDGDFFPSHIFCIPPTMKFSAFLTLPVATQAINVVISNDDGWAEINIRQLYNSLTKAGYNSIISAPAENKSGTGSSDEEPEKVGSDGCEFASCPAGSPPYGKNESEPQFNVSVHTVQIP